MGKSKELAELGQVVTQSGGNVGIGASVPEYALHLKGSYPYIAFEDTDSGSTSQHTITGNSDGNMYFDSVINNASGNSGFRFRHNSASITSLAIDASGRVTMPYQPAFCVGLNSGQLSGGSYYVFNVVQANIGNHYSTSTGRFTAPVTGMYCFLFHNILGSGTTSDSDVQLRVNGARHGEARSSGGVTNWVTASIVKVISLDAGDYVQIYADTGVHYGGDEYWCEFSGYLIG